jgi:hypothetical protein
MAASAEIISTKDGRLLDLTIEIKVEHQAVVGSFKSGFHHAVRCGALLFEAKKIAGHGGWLPWFKANRWITSRTASDYMRLAANRTTIEAKSADSADLTIQAALRLLSSPKPQASTTKAKAKEDIPDDEEEAERQRLSRLSPAYRKRLEREEKKQAAVWDAHRAVMRRRYAEMQSILGKLPSEDRNRLRELAGEWEGGCFLAALLTDASEASGRQIETSPPPQQVVAQ